MPGQRVGAVSTAPIYAGSKRGRRAGCRRNKTTQKSPGCTPDSQWLFLLLSSSFVLPASSRTPPPRYSMPVTRSQQSWVGDVNFKIKERNRVYLSLSRSSIPADLPGFHRWEREGEKNTRERGRKTTACKLVSDAPCKPDDRNFECTQTCSTLSS